MKSYTDVNQSKKLAEILPLESADMCYDWFVIGKEYSSIPQCRKFIDDELPCWSLAALLEQLDDSITNDDGNDLLLEIKKEDGLYYLNYHDSRGWQDDIETDYYYDLVDACYEMILKLNEQKLL